MDATFSREQETKNNMTHHYNNESMIGEPFSKTSQSSATWGLAPKSDDVDALLRQQFRRATTRLGAMRTMKTTPGINAARGSASGFRKRDIFLLRRYSLN
ncbi:hypothetical protein PRK78_004659 [Emydomyces testavorans]|uniref:Uncharacterized protein n=1 Tax=Emydomyces testavorans TaxID=2070801 RepID=A0AAF0DIE1_9EURO|nr:hypothetical protein PRK78_004659 [Emydomyces testavorans]